MTQKTSRASLTWTISFRALAVLVATTPLGAHAQAAYPSSITVTGTKRPRMPDNLAPRTPKQIRREASTSSGNAYSLCMRRLRA